ncbi:MAG: hypothetical protein QG574_5640, partial [Cyanobacteriota bacterium erpe_2018_sw_21hr_WHONDRS-SW48-000092_B_bin.40]|nr:hypothetical protein [Cyanobacteriota bacterium erpe_2018_sw_21hr_WHONDRS-SW48-000092_B_bin.40]
MRKEKQTPTEDLKAEAKSEADLDILQVRRVVAGNPNTPRQVLARLADDKSASIRRAVAENPRTPVELLKKL